MAQEYVDLYAAKDRVFSALREGFGTFSGLLVKTQLPEETLRIALDLLEQEHKVKPVQEAEEPAFTLPASGWWPFSQR